MLTPGILNRGIIRRMLPTKKPSADGEDREIFDRNGPYGEKHIIPVSIPWAAAADEGSFFVDTNPTLETGLATTAAPIAFSDTAAFYTCYNTDPVGGRRIALAYLKLVSTVVGAGPSTGVKLAVTIDEGDRYASGGAQLIPQNPNMDAEQSDAAEVWAGAVVLAAATQSVRRPVSSRWLKRAVHVVGDQYMVFFGSDTPARAAGVDSVDVLPPIIIGPRQSVNIHLWLPAQSAASNFEIEVGRIVR